MRAPVDPSDHAFADGAVYPRVTTVADARRLMDGQRHPAEAAETLLEVWRSFTTAGIVGEGVRLGLNARLVNLGEPSQAVIDGPCGVRGILRVERAGRLRIEPFVYIGDDTIVSAMADIVIGRATLLAHGVQVFDNNTHPINAYQREVQFRRMLGDKSVTAPLEIEASPVVIGKRCWIGMNALVMRGVTIGDDTIVAAGSVVIKSLPAGVIAAGNPATVLRELTPEERGMAAQREQKERT